jgi:hypothetical protein
MVQLLMDTCVVYVNSFLALYVLSSSLPLFPTSHIAHHLSPPLFYLSAAYSQAADFPLILQV